MATGNDQETGWRAVENAVRESDRNLGEKMDGLGEKLGGKMDGLGEKIDRGFQGLTDVIGQNTRDLTRILERETARLERQSARMDGHEARIERLESDSRPIGPRLAAEAAPGRARSPGPVEPPKSS